MIPERFAATIREVHGDSGSRWLEDLPALLAGCAERWALRIEGPFAELSYNYVTAVHCADGTEAVLKVGPPTPDLLSEMRVLRHLEGRGVARLLQSDEARGALLLERLRPGEPLPLGDPEGPEIAAGVMRELWTVPPTHLSFRTAGDWIRQMGAKGPGLLATPEGRLFPGDWLRRAGALHAELESRPEEPVLLHGDLHPGNLLSSGEGWRAIDAWGIVGERACEPGPFLLNVPTPTPSRLGDLVERFSAELRLDPRRVRDCALVRAVISAFWTLEDHGHGWEPAITTAEALASLRL